MIIPNYIIFTDLDATLLDHHTYSFEAALSALKKIKDRNIPLILTSSKTRAEIEKLRTKLQNQDPFIVENGGAIYIPEKYFLIQFSFQKKQDGYLVIELGTPYPKLRQACEIIQSKTGLSLVGFGDLTPEKLVNKTGLSLEEAQLAIKRQYDEPFLIENEINESKFEQIKKIVSDLGLKLTIGGRFYHLTGENDKGKAVRMLISIFEKEWGGEITTIGIGDSLNDLPMLQAVDTAILVQTPTGEYDKAVLAKIEPTLAKGIGPEGWNEAVLKIIKD